MKFKIDGADPKSGAERSIVIEAANAMDAQLTARESGMLVVAVKEIKESTPAADHANPEVPEYEALRLVAWLFRMNALAGYVVGGVGLIITAIFFAGAAGNDRDMLPKSGFCLIWASGAFVYGLTSHAVSEFLSAFRDLVRNSFK